MPFKSYGDTESLRYKSGILDDPNGWFADPRDLITALKRVVCLSVETVRIVEGLPEPFAAKDGLAG